MSLPEDELDYFDCEVCNHSLVTTPGHTVVCDSCDTLYVTCGDVVELKQMIRSNQSGHYIFACSKCTHALQESNYNGTSFTRC